MNENMQAELAEWIKKGGEFVEREAPLYVSEVIAWYFWSSTLAAAASFAVLAACIFAMFKFRKMILKKEYGAPTPEGALVGMIGGCIALVCLILGLTWTCEAIKAKVAPRVVVVESLKASAN